MYGCIRILTFPNALGIYQPSYKPGKTRITAYYITTPNLRLREMPGGNSKWYDKIVSEQPRTVATRNIPVKRSLPEGSRPATMTASTQKIKRRHTRSCVPDNGIDVIDLVARDRMLLEMTRVH
jgi:hypothetical protein